jgi:hypothetical protein
MPACPFHNQPISPARRFGKEKKYDFVARSTMQPIAAVNRNSKYRFKGSLLIASYQRAKSE